MNETSLELRKFVSPEFVIGVDARFITGRYAKNFKADNIFLVTEKEVITAGWVKDIIKSLDEQAVKYSIFSDISPNPRDYEIMKGAEIYKEKGCNAIVAVGGGSVIDCAKGIGIVATNNDNILTFEGVDNIPIPIPPLICVPTTSGSSADVSQFAIITDTLRKVKIAIVSKQIVPDISLLDPVPLTSLSPKLTASTGLDALIHSIEAYVSNASSPVTDIHALESIRLLSSYLPLAYHHPDNIGYRYKTMVGSLFAGLAFSNASLGAVHAMAHSLGGFSDLPHGICNAILLEGVVNFNFDACPGRYASIAQAMDIDCSSGIMNEIKTRLISALVCLRKEVGVTENLKDLGIKKEDIPKLVKNAMYDPCMATNPKRPTFSDLESIYGQLL
jgi:alcohol dehydrogenase